MTEIKRFEVATGKIKLSEAIRIGAKIRPQCSGSYFAKGGSCALGAAMEAYTGNPAEDKFWIEKIYNELGEDRMEDLILRNDAGQSRESIADWLERQGL